MQSVLAHTDKGAPCTCPYSQRSPKKFKVVHSHTQTHTHTQTKTHAPFGKRRRVRAPRLRLVLSAAAPGLRAFCGCWASPCTHAVSPTPLPSRSCVRLCMMYLRAETGSKAARSPRSGVRSLDLAHAPKTHAFQLPGADACGNIGGQRRPDEDMKRGLNIALAHAGRGGGQAADVLCY